MWYTACVVPKPSSITLSHLVPNWFHVYLSNLLLQHQVFWMDLSPIAPLLRLFRKSMRLLHQLVPSRTRAFKHGKRSSRRLPLCGGGGRHPYRFTTLLRVLQAHRRTRLNGKHQTSNSMMQRTRRGRLRAQLFVDTAPVSLAQLHGHRQPRPLMMHGIPHEDSVQIPARRRGATVARRCRAHFLGWVGSETRLTLDLHHRQPPLPLPQHLVPLG